MHRGELEHLIRAAGSLLRVDRLLIIGSQSILGTFPEDRLPAEATRRRSTSFRRMMRTNGLRI